MSATDHVGDIAIVLHSHMPYVEGFGTYPFGEEWLFDAVIRSHLPVLGCARDVTLSITPVLADQLEAPGVPERLLEFTRELRVGSARREAADMEPAYEAACLAEAERYAGVLAQLEGIGGRALDAFAAASESGRIELLASTATHAIVPLLATRAGRRLQVETGLRSHRRRFGGPGGIWLPECAYAPGTEDCLREAGYGYFCVDQSAHELPGEALSPIRMDGMLAMPIDWEAVQWLWSMQGYPSDPRYADFHKISLRGSRAWTIGGHPYDPAAAGARAREQAGEFVTAIADRLRAYRDRAGEPGLLTFAIDTELLGHWWWEGPIWLEAVLEQLPGVRVRALKLGDAAAEHAPRARDVELLPSSWGEAKDLRTWDSPPVADLAWGARSLELRVLREAGTGALRGDSLMRAARELLAVQSSDWAFLDYQRQAGDYPWSRVLDHSRALLEAVESGAGSVPQVRNLAPDLSPAPLLEP